MVKRLTHAFGRSESCAVNKPLEKDQVPTPFGKPGVEAEARVEATITNGIYLLLATTESKTSNCLHTLSCLQGRKILNRPHNVLGSNVRQQQHMDNQDHFITCPRPRVSLRDGDVATS